MAETNWRVLVPFIRAIKNLKVVSAETHEHRGIYDISQT